MPLRERQGDWTHTEKACEDRGKFEDVCLGDYSNTSTGQGMSTAIP